MNHSSPLPVQSLVENLYLFPREEQIQNQAEIINNVRLRATLVLVHQLVWTLHQGARAVATRSRNTQSR
jgi:hypothetical protein